LATQNPIEQAGTYKLPEAELDRFMMKTFVEYPTIEEESEILTKIIAIETSKVTQILSQADILNIQKLISHTHVSESIIQYITHIIEATRKQHKYLSY
jgi:MoxR-like ATPase